MHGTTNDEGNRVKKYTTCTTAGPLFVHVKDGKIIRTEPLSFTEEEFKPWSIEVNGKTYQPPQKWPVLSWGHTAKQWVYSANRTRYPLKRVDWDPNGNRNPQNRGKSGYVRISWDEANDLLIAELQRVVETYGPSAILAGSSGHPEWGSLHYFFSDFKRFFNIIGHTSREVTPMSWEGWFAGACFMYGHFPDMGILPAPDTLQDISQESELIVFWGTDPIMHNVYTGIDYAKPFQFWKELGKKMIVIDPYHNDTAAAYADKWIPIIPGTDAAMAAAIAFLWIQAGTYDQDYLDTHAIGFDEAHLPPVAPQGTSFKSYILGESDGIPKTPAWAEKITGVPARMIVALAKEWAAKPTSLWAMIGGACRRAYAHEFSRMMVTLQAMQGLGKPGVNLISSAINMAGPRDRRQVGPPGYGDGGINGVAREFPQNSVNQEITEIVLDQAILNPPLKWKGGRILNLSPDDFFAEHEYPAPGCSEIHMIWSRGDTYLNMPNRNRDLQVYQHSSIETIVVQDPFFNRDARYADIVLPVTTNFEREDLTEPSFVGTYMPLAVINNRCAVFHRRCIEPVGESKDDYAIMSELARRLGFEDRYTEGNTVESWLRKMYAKSNVPLTFDELKERGYYAWPATPDYQPCKQLELFYKDPDNNPLDTPTGKLEIFSTLLYSHYGADNPEIPPVPHYIPEWEGRYTEGLVEKYPLQLLTTHPKFRFHGKFDDIDFTREIYKVKGPDGYEYEPIVMNPIDAKQRGLHCGDIALAFNERGQILCGVVTTERMAQGVIWISYGSWNDPMEPKPCAVDRAGDSNILTTSRPMSAHHLGYAVNSTLVEVEKADLDRLAELYPEGWAGKFSTWNRE